MSRKATYRSQPRLPTLKAMTARVASYGRRLRILSTFRVVNPARYILDWGCLPLSSGVREALGGPDRATKVLLISDAREPYSEEQFYPFSLCRSDIRDAYNLISVHLLISDVLRFPLILKLFDVVILKLSFRTAAEEALKIVRTVSNALDGRRLVYFDGDDDLCVQWPEILPYVDLYVKKHMFRDRNQYLKSFVGKCNLTDFIHRRYGFSFANDPIAVRSGPVAADQLFKLSLGTTLASDRNMVRLFNSSTTRPNKDTRDYDVIFRGTIPDDWMRYLRQDVTPALERLSEQYRAIKPVSLVSIEDYYQEMRRSRICISPFGHGEICYRDFEAIICGCLLIKPDMSHVETNPDIFRPYQTYVPVQWDFADLVDKCSYYLNNKDECRRIADQELSPNLGDGWGQAAAV